MNVWITKYALTSGIFEAEAEICGPGMILLKRDGRYPELYHGEGRDWHGTKESASDRLSVLKEKKIASLKASIKKIEKIVF